MAALTAALMALQGSSAISQYSQQKRAGNYEAAIAGQNAGLANEQANNAIARGAAEESRSRMGTRQVLGSQRASFGASGVDVAAGSPVDVYGDTARVGELQAMTIRNNAALEAWGYQVEGANYRAEQANAKQRARDAWPTLLTGAANVFGTYAANRSSSSSTPSESDYARWGKTVSGAKIGRK